MLKTVKELDTKSFDTASIGTKKEFPILESYIAYLFRKYAGDYITSAQHSKYYLIYWKKNLKKKLDEL